MTNAVGYYHYEREERLSQSAQHGGKKSYDINRDFPYNQDRSSDCLNTVAGRVLYEIYTKNNFVATLTFHGGTNVLGYPWGSYNHSYKKGREYVGYVAPDHTSFEAFGRIMQEKAGQLNFKNDSRQNTRQYVLGDMSSTVYPVGGGLEDWAYGAAWDIKD